MTETKRKKSSPQGEAPREPSTAGRVGEAKKKPVRLRSLALRRGFVPNRSCSEKTDIRLRGWQLPDPRLNRIEAQQSGFDSEAKKFPVRLRSLAARRGFVPNREFLSWSRVRESNPPVRLGKPTHYRCTNPASLTLEIITDFASQCKSDFPLLLSRTGCFRRSSASRTAWPAANKPPRSQGQWPPPASASYRRSRPFPPLHPETDNRRNNRSPRRAPG